MREYAVTESRNNQSQNKTTLLGQHVCYINYSNIITNSLRNIKRRIR